jgi:hypothetical protein
MSRKPYEHRDRRYVPEFVATHLQDRRAAFFNLRVGPAPEEMKRAHPDLPETYFRPWKYMVDAVVVTDKEIIVIEGELRRPSMKIGQLKMYGELVRQTPELAPYLDRPIRKILVTPREDPLLLDQAGREGVEVVFYRPLWVMEYLRTLGFAE